MAQAVSKVLAPEHHLSDFYQALTAVQQRFGVSDAQRSAVNAIFSQTYRLQLSDDEIRLISKYLVTLGFIAMEIPDFIRQRYGLDAGVGAMVWQSDDSGVAEKLGLVDGDIATEFNGKRILKGNDFRDLLEIQKFLPGLTMSVTYLRNGQAIKTQAILERTTPASLIRRLVYEKYHAKKC